MSRRTKKWTKKLFFHLTVLAIVVVPIIHRCWRIYDKKFQRAADEIPCGLELECNSQWESPKKIK
jgi:hypothetical protein